MGTFNTTIAHDIFTLDRFPTEQVWLGRPGTTANGDAYQRVHLRTCTSEADLPAHQLARQRLSTAPCCGYANQAMVMLEMGSAADYLLHVHRQASDVLGLLTNPDDPQLIARAWEVVVAAKYTYTGVLGGLERFLNHPEDADAAEDPQLHQDVFALVQSRVDAAHDAFDTRAAEFNAAALLRPDFLSYGPGQALCMLDPSRATSPHTFKVTAAEAAAIDVLQAVSFVRGGRRRGPVRAMLLPLGVANLIGRRSFGTVPVGDDFDPAKLPLLEQMFNVDDPEANSLEHLVAAAHAASA